jgi:putative acetyltransferase
MVIIRPERPADIEAIRQVNLLAFGQLAEAALVDALRQAGDITLSLVADEDGVVIGHILFSRLRIHTDAGGVVDAVALAPMAVRPDRQRRGIGSALVAEALRECRERGERIAIVVGHTRFYPRFGFSHDAAAPLRSAFQCDAFMAVGLRPGALQGVTGTVEYSVCFGALE